MAKVKIGILCRIAAFLLLGASGLTAQTARPLSPLLADDSGDPITDRAAWLKQRELIRNRWQSFLGEWPQQKAPLKSEVIGQEDLADFTRQHVKYQIEEGVFTDAYLLIPNNKVTGRRPAVVVFHPTVSNHTHQVAGIDASNAEKMHGVQLAQHGYVVLCPRCFIFDEGAGYAEHVKRMQARHPGWTGMMRMTWDAVRAADYLESLPQVDKQRIGCLGHSLGAKEALYAAAFDPRYQAAVFSEGGIGLGFSNWEAVWYLGPRIQQADFKREHHELIALIAPRGFLLLAGESADGERSGAFIDAARPVYDLLGAKEGLSWLNHRLGHRYPPAARAAAEEFLDRHLQRTNPARPNS